MQFSAFWKCYSWLSVSLDHWLCIEGSNGLNSFLLLLLQNLYGCAHGKISIFFQCQFCFCYIYIVLALFVVFVGVLAALYKAAFTLGHVWGKRIRTYCLSVKSYHLGCSFTLIRWKHTMKMATFESGNKSVYFENGTKLHLSFSSCKQQKLFETSKIRYWHVIFHMPRLTSRDSRCCRLARIHLIRF